MEDGTIGHAELELDGEIVMLATPNRDYQSPKRHRETCDAARRWLDNPWVVDGVLVLVDDLDAHHARAVGRRGDRDPASGGGPGRPRSTPRRISRVTAGCSSSAVSSRRVPHEPRPRPLRRGVRAPALARRRGLAGSDPGDGDLPRAPAGGHDRAAHRDGQRAPHPGDASRSRSPRPTAAGSRRSTGRASSSATRSSTSGTTART